MKYIFIPLCALFLLPLTAATLHANNARSKCISYWAVGDSGCDGAEAVSVTEDILPEPVVLEPELPLEPPGPPPLEQRVQEFMDDHGKPPREFVAFHLEPTLENALKWVQKYEEMLNRNRRLAGAWNQARILYEEAKQQGVAEELPQLDEPLPDVPNFGVQLPAEMAWFMQEDQMQTFAANDPFSVFGGPFSQVGGAVIFINRVGSTPRKTTFHPTNDPRQM